MANIFKRITATVLVLVMCFSVALPSVSAANDTYPSNFEEYRKMLNGDEYPALSTAQFMKVVDVFNTAYRLLTGRIFIEQKFFKFSTDAMLTEICNHITAESGLDLLMITTHLPETKQYAEFVTKTFDIDTVAVRNKFYQLRYEQNAQGNWVMASVYYFLGMYFSIIDDCQAYCVPLEEENCYEIYLKIVLRDGTVENTSTGIAINTETSLVYAKDGKGIIATGYNFYYDDLVVYTLVDVWMRDFGFMLFYDFFSYTTPFFFYSTRRIKFDYDGVEWMIQVWKGNYLISNGAEVGIYTREPGSIGSYYNCANDSQMMKMSLKLYHGDELILERPEQLHWWVTGFRISDVLYPANKQTVHFTIEMKDEEMLKAFCEAIDKHYRHDMSYTVDGLKVSVVW